MSVKRQATTDLNHDNWDQEDPEDHEDMGSFKAAPKEVIEKRVIRTAKRRNPITVGDGQAKKSVFSGFGGFNKTQPSSFDFLANLTNKTANESDGSKKETVTNTVFKIDNPVTNTLSSGLGLAPSSTSTPFGTPFKLPTSSSQKPTFGLVPTSQTLFGTVAPGTSPTSNLFSTVKQGSDEAQKKDTVPLNVFGIPAKTSTNNDKSLSIPITSKDSPKTETKNTNSHTENDKRDQQQDDKKIRYYSNIKMLNECVSEWIQKHVKANPLCLLTPIFRDYEKYLKEMQDEYDSINEDDKPKSQNTETKTESISSGFTKEQKSATITENTASTSPIAKADIPPVSVGFSFGINSNVTQTPKTSLFSMNSNSSPTVNGNSPFSFSAGKPFSFSPNTLQKPPETKEEKEEDEEPPKVEFTPIIEENSVYDKRCKIFIKKDGNFVDNGVGTLYIKKIEESEKYQLLVRANTNLGNVLINLRLASAIPFQRMGKNNVMMVCIPTPDSEPPPTTVLIRVKTAEEADELLETLNKYKG